MEACVIDPGASSCIEAQRTTNGTAKSHEGETGTDRMCGTSGDGTGRTREATVPPSGSDGQLRLVLQVRSESRQVREEAWRTVCWASENSRVCTKHSLAIERLAPQGTSLSWITETVHCAKHGQGGGKATKGTTVLAELRQTVIRLRMAEAQPDESR